MLGSGREETGGGVEEDGIAGPPESVIRPLSPSRRENQGCKVIYKGPSPHPPTLAGRGEIRNVQASTKDRTAPSQQQPAQARERMADTKIMSSQAEMITLLTVVSMSTDPANALVIRAIIDYCIVS